MSLTEKNCIHSLASCEEAHRRLPRRVRQQLLISCLLFPDKHEDEYIYVGDALKRFGDVLLFWKKKRRVSTREQLIGSLLK
ncbi:MAG: hypothetical protein H6618_04955 [Deltaproteobacteria bacterium]|nr:hypothetical protein [Deltaproteobacteria bacterium]